MDPAGYTERNLLNPAKWNRYTYTLNNPLKLVDPDGREEVEIQLNTFIPERTKQLGNVNVAGDAREFGVRGSSRTSQTQVIETDQRRSASGLIGPARLETGPSDAVVIAGLPLHGTGKASGNSLSVGGERAASNAVTVNFSGNEKFPLFPSPGITVDLAVTVTSSGADAPLQVQIAGSVDGYPAVELNITRKDQQNSPTTNIPLFDPRTALEAAIPLVGNTPFILFPVVGDRQVDESVLVP